MNTITPKEAVERLRAWQAQIIHGPNTFGHIADLIECLDREKRQAECDQEQLTAAGEAFARIREIVGATDADPLPAEHYVSLFKHHKEAELARAKADTERLDWLEEGEDHSRMAYRFARGFTAVSQNACHDASRIREAIDAARKS